MAQRNVVCNMLISEFLNPKEVALVVLALLVLWACFEAAMECHSHYPCPTENKDSGCIRIGLPAT